MRRDVCEQRTAPCFNSGFIPKHIVIAAWVLRCYDLCSGSLIFLLEISRLELRCRNTLAAHSFLTADEGLLHFGLDESIQLR
jgi:hypothetical protein